MTGQPDDIRHDHPTSNAVCAGALLVVLTAAVYLPALRGDFLWDDDQYIERNPLVRLPDRFSEIWLRPRSSPQFYPLVFTTFWLEHRLWGLDTFGYHAVNVLLHATSAVLLWRILALWGLRVAWFAAALFALHPVHVESVAWITERKNTLSGVFYLSAALSYLHWQGARLQSKRYAWQLYVLALVLFVCALLSKTVTASLPAALLLVTWWQRGRLTRQDVFGVFPMFLVGIPLALLTAWLEKVHVGAAGAEFEPAFTERVLVAGRVPWFYAGKLLLPLRLSFIYPKWSIDPAVWWQYLFPAATICVVAALWFSRHVIGRGPLVAVLFFGGTLLPVSGFFDVFPMKYSYVADHFQYLASIGMLVLIAVTCRQAFEKVGAGRSAPLAGVVVLVLLGLLTFIRSYAFSGPEVLWRDALRQNPACEMLHTNLGTLLQDEGRLDEAHEHLRVALDLAPDDALTNMNFGLLLYELGRTDESIAYLKKAVKCDPGMAQAHANLGGLLTDHGDPQEALAHLQRAVTLDPGKDAAHYNLGRAYQRLGRTREAEESFRTSRRILQDSLLPGDLTAE